MPKKIKNLIALLVASTFCTSCSYISGDTKTALSSGDTIFSDAVTIDVNTTDKIVEIESNVDTESTTETEIESKKNIIDSATEQSKSIIEIIDRNLDILVMNSNGFSSEQDFIDAHPEAFSEIVALGKEALPYLMNYAMDPEKNSAARNYSLCLVSRAVAYAIEPSIYDLSFESPDGQTLLTISVSTFASGDYPLELETTYSTLFLIDTDSGSKNEIAKFAYTSLNVYWSENSRYAALIGTQKNRCFPITALLIDTVSGNCTDLPTLEIYNSIIKENVNKINFLSISLIECEWISDEQLKINFNLNTGASYYPQTTSGWYIWDMNTHTVGECTYEAEKIDIAETSFSADEIVAVVDKNLDILTNGSNGFYSEEEFIATHPEAFAEIVALGEAALTYLEEVNNADPMDTSSLFTGEISKGLAAKIVAYVIKPSLYDLVFTSPDGAYNLRLGVQSFLCTEWGGTITTAYNQADIISCAENRITLAYDAGQRYYGAYSHVSVEWSPDSAYVAVQCSDQKFYSITDIYDVKSPALITLPSIEESIIPMVMPESDISENKNLDYTEYCVDAWLDNDKVKIKYYFRYGHFQEGKGDYIYDIIAHNISTVEYTALNYNTAGSGAPNEGMFVYLRSEASIDIRAKYPVLSGATPAKDLINRQIKEYITSIYEWWIEDDSVAANDSIKSVMLYEITQLDEDILSIHFSTSFAGGGSTQYVTDAGLTFNMKTGDSVALESLYDVEIVSRFIDKYFDLLDKTLYPTLFSLYKIRKLQ